MAQLMFPNIVDAMNAGVDRGNQMTFNRLAGQYIGDPSNNAPLLAQAAQLNPGAALGIQGAVQQQQATQQATQQQQQQQQLQKIGAAARYYKNALASGDPSTIMAAKQAIYPFLSQMATAQGKPAPSMQDMDSPQAMAGLDNVIAQTAFLYPDELKPQKPMAVGPDQTLIDPRTHQVIYQGAGDAGSMVQGMTYHGMPVFRDKQGNLKDVRGNPIPQGASDAPTGAQGLPAETQAYVPKVMAALGGQSPFDASGQPTPQLLDAVMRVESDGNPNAVSPAGAQGPYQFMPATAASVGVQNPFDPIQARAGAAKYLAQLYQQFGGNAQQAIAAYNAGPGRVSQAMSGGSTAGGLQYTGGTHQFSSMTPDQIASAGLPKGTVAQMGPNGQIHVVSKPGGQAGEPMQFGDPTKTGADYFNTLSPDVAQQVKALDEGRMQFPSSFALKTPYWQGMLAAVSRYDPSFDAINYNTRASTRKAFTSGKEATQVNALNTVAQHLSQLQNYADQLDNTSIPFVNSVKNAVEQNVGSASPTNFKRTVLPVAQELERVWRGTGGSEGDIKQWMNNLSSSSSPAQFKAAFSGLSDLIYGKLAALRDQYVQGMGTTSNPYQFLSPSTQAIFSKLDAVDAGKFANNASAGNGAGLQGGGSTQAAQPNIDTLLSKYGVK